MWRSEPGALIPGRCRVQIHPRRPKKTACAGERPSATIPHLAKTWNTAKTRKDNFYDYGKNLQGHRRNRRPHAARPIESSHGRSARDHPAEVRICQSAGQREGPHRSEEHTSELQSRQYLVCRLLLEKKKKKTTKTSGYETTSQQ